MLKVNPNIYSLLPNAMIRKMNIRKKYVDFLYLINFRKKKNVECPFQSIDLSCPFCCNVLLSLLFLKIGKDCH